MNYAIPVSMRINPISQEQGPTTAGIMTSSRCDKHSGRKPSISGGGAYPWLGPLGSILCLLRDGSVAEALGTSGPEVPGTAQVSSRGKKRPQGVPRTSKVFTKAPEGLTGSLGVLWFPRRWGLHGMSGGTRCASCTEFEGNVN